MSDYGSDIALDDILDDEHVLAAVLNTINQDRATLPSIEFEEGELEDEDEDVDGFVQVHRPTVLRVARNKTNASANLVQDIQSSPVREREALEVEYDARSRRAWSGMSSLLHRGVFIITSTPMN